MNYRKIILTFALAMLGTLAAYAQMPSCSAISQFYTKDSINMVTFGASTVQGVGGFSFQGYLQQNFQYCYPGKTITVTNNGVFGQTSTVALPRYIPAITGRTGFVLILIGANDAQLMAKNQMELAETEKNMRFFIEEAQKRNLIPIIGTIQFFNDKGDQFLKTCNLYVKQINTLYFQLAKEYNLHVADINRAIGRDFSLYQDYVHPNDKGYHLIAFVWFDAVNRVIENTQLSVGLNQNYPNPAGGSTSIGFSLSQPGKVTIQLYNMNGLKVMDVLNEYSNSGYHVVNVNLTGLSPGIYIYMMQFGGQQLSKKLIVMR